jgi:tRNA threonylcarbamoyl adenosine modification protein (Sua5/YciO/YrdC/YwlC family)
VSEREAGVTGGAALGDAIAVLRGGGIVGVPTDTVYGIAADPLQREALASLFAVKGRPGIKPIALLAASLDQVDRVAVLGGEARRSAEANWPGPLTVVVRRAPGLPEWLGDPERDTIGVRIPDHPVMLALLDAWGAPLAATSANRSGEPPASDAAGARTALGEAVPLYLPGLAGGGTSSTVVDLSGPEAVVLRKGPIEWETR